MPLNVLIAEDEGPLRRAMKNHLENGGHRVYDGKDGSEAWELFKNHKIDVCIIDVLMPLLNGNQLVKLIREKDKDVPVFLFTNFEEKTIYEEALRTGVQGILLKVNTPLSTIGELLLRLEHGQSYNDLLL